MCGTHGVCLSVLYHAMNHPAYYIAGKFGQGDFFKVTQAGLLNCNTGIMFCGIYF